MGLCPCLGFELLDTPSGCNGYQSRKVSQLDWVWGSPNKTYCRLHSWTTQFGRMVSVCFVAWRAAWCLWQINFWPKITKLCTVALYNRVARSTGSVLELPLHLSLLFRHSFKLCF